ncbi:hypothetical protein GGX14DRAFT_429468, partial [Mycena pura]
NARPYTACFAIHIGGSELLTSPHLPMDPTLDEALVAAAGEPCMSTGVCLNGTNISSAVVFFYDFILTLPQEITFYVTLKFKFKYRWRQLCCAFLSLRYFSAAYQGVILLAVIRRDWIPKVRRLKAPKFCSTWDTLALSFDSAFQICFVLYISNRMRVLFGHLPGGMALVAALIALGLSAPLINVALPNPSVFAQCRFPYSVPTSRSIFDAITTLMLVWLLYGYQKRRKLRRGWVDSNGSKNSDLGLTEVTELMVEGEREP